MDKGGGAVPNTAIAGAPIPRQSHAFMSQDALERVVAQVWEQRLGLSLHRLRGHPPAGFSVSASIPLVGAGSAVAMLRAPFEVAAAAAVGLLGLHRDEVAPGDVDDAFTQLVVAVGHAIGGLLSGPNALGPASIVRGVGLTAAAPGSPTMGEVALYSGAGAIHLSVWGRWPALAARVR